jgi:hypothetical protein
VEAQAVPPRTAGVPQSWAGFAADLSEPGDVRIRHLDADLCHDIPGGRIRSGRLGVLVDADLDGADVDPGEHQEAGRLRGSSSYLRRPTR